MADTKRPFRTALKYASAVLLIVAAVPGFIFLLWQVPHWVVNYSERKVGEELVKTGIVTPQKLTIKEHIELENGVRGTLATILTGGFFVLTFYATWRNLRATEGTLAVSQENLNIAREGQLTERFARAIEHLADEDSLTKRLGGIYALGEIIKHSEHLQPVVDCLTAYVRMKSVWRQGDQQTIIESDDGRQRIDPPLPSLDIQAILTILGRRTTTAGQGENKQLDLHGTDLRRLDLRYANLKHAILDDANVSEADLSYAHLEQAQINNAYLNGTRLYRAHLEGTILQGSNLNGAGFEGAHLKDAMLSNAHLEYTNLTKVLDLTWEQLRTSHMPRKLAYLPDYLQPVARAEHSFDEEGS
jgi:hypothetical protein